MVVPEEYAPDGIIKRVNLKAGEKIDSVNLVGMTKEELSKNMKPPK